MKNISAREILERLKRNPIQKTCGKIKPQVIGHKKRKAARLKRMEKELGE